MSDLFARFEFKEIKSYSKFIATRGYNFHLFQNGRNSELLSRQMRFQSKHVSLWDINAMSFSNELEIFKNNLRRTLPPSLENTWGVCASEITPALCYFMGTNLEEIEGIFDTTSTKEYKFMPGLAPQVLSWENLNHVQKDSALYITVPQLSSVVKPKLSKLGFTNVSFAEK